MRQLTKKEAIMICENKLYEGMSDLALVDFQIHQDRLCMPFDLFHEKVEKVLGHPVWTHQFADQDKLIKEFETKYYKQDENNRTD